MPEDEYTHEPDPVPNYNESMYLNGFDLEREVGAWFRIGNRHGKATKGLPVEEHPETWLGSTY